MNRLLLTFDIEDFNTIKRTKNNKKELFNIGKKGTKIILNLLKKKHAKATFFVTNEFAQNEPEIVKRIVREGHELASHGYIHSDNYRDMSKDKALLLLTKSRHELEHKFKTKVRGFRAPRMEYPSYEVIKKAGFSYDSSLHPTWVPGHYNNLFRKRKLHKEDGLTIVPVSVSVFRKPFSWFWFRNFGLYYVKLCTLTNFNNYVNIYFHPWEFVDIKDKNISFFIKRNTGRILVKNLGKYIDWCLKRNIKSSTITEFLKTT